MNHLGLFIAIGLLWLVGAAVVAFGFAIAARARRPQCSRCLGREVEEDDFGLCRCLECHHSCASRQRDKS